MSLSHVSVPNNIPPTTAVTYSANMILGGLMTFPILAGGGRLDHIRVTSKSIQTASIKIYLFDSAPTATTWTNNTTPAIVAADAPKLRSVFTLANADNGLGTHTIWTKEAIALDFTVLNLYAIAFPTAALNAGGANDFEFKFGIVVNTSIIPESMVLQR